MNAILRNGLVVAGMAVATQAVAQITFYEHDDFEGQSFTTGREVANLERYGFNDRASSIVVARDRWEVCEDARFGGRCVVLRPGRYPSLDAMGMKDAISSVRMVSRNARIDEDRYAPAYAPAPPAYAPAPPAYAPAPPAYAPAPVARPDYSRRDNERLYEANVTYVHAVVGPPEQRCWIEREQVVQDRGNANVPGAIAGAIIGGVLGHQIGHGRGQDAATAGGAVAGAAVGANAGRDGGQVYSQNVQRCENVNNRARPEYWDVTYDFRGQEHRIQMSAPPGPTVTVNDQGEPRM